MHLPLSPACNMLVYSAACTLSNYQTVNNNYYNQLALSRRHIKLFTWHFQSIRVVWSILSTSVSVFRGSDGNSIHVALLSQHSLVQSVIPHLISIHKSHKQPRGEPCLDLSSANCCSVNTYAIHIIRTFGK